MKRILCAIIGLSAIGNCGYLRAQGKTKTIYSFVAPPGPTYPAAGLALGQGGVLYGTTLGGGSISNYRCGYFNCGTVYELTPPAAAGGSWTETTLYSFDPSNGGYAPASVLLRAPIGTLYGWAAYGGSAGLGVAFQLTPPTSPGGSWAQTTLYNFQGEPADPGAPIGNLALGGNGALYGATSAGGTYNQGTVFELSPPASPGNPWISMVLYSFRGDGDGINPAAGVVIGGSGAVYGSTLSGGSVGYGTLFALKRNGGVWQERVLASLGSHQERPNGVILGSRGALYGQSGDYGVFKAVPPGAGGGQWVIESIAGVPNMFPQSITLGQNGTIYLTTPQGGNSTACGVNQGCGALYELLPPASPGGTWTTVLLHSFTGQHGDGYQPNAGLVVTKKGTVYGTTYYGGDNFFGTVFRYTP